MTWLVIATEDEVSEQIGKRLAQEAGLEVGLCIGKQGNGYLRKRIPNLCQMSEQQPILLITDLDQIAHPQILIKEWLGTKKPSKNLVFRVAVREIESWILADHVAMRTLLGPKVSKLPQTPDELADPKQALLALAQKAHRDVRDDLVVSQGSVSSQGFGYNARLSQLISTVWCPERASARSPSLSRARARLQMLA
ncbi:hypothetical protein [Burkholderia seminalis]|uniref:hypothetical protein n=1 Tax=Burkholderia seminalis TaxID=488731 RepID=UPI00264FAEFD|nr:hypothetical protein [Burkholderia seminalis]MDN7852111.1 hypothetical protein [Burkholderia seminalis]